MLLPGPFFAGLLPEGAIHACTLYFHINQGDHENTLGEVSCSADSNLWQVAIKTKLHVIHDWSGIKKRKEQKKIPKKWKSIFFMPMVLLTSESTFVQYFWIEEKNDSLFLEIGALHNVWAFLYKTISFQRKFNFVCQCFFSK